MGKRQQFTLFANAGGVNQHRGELLADPRFAADIINMHIEKLGQWSAHSQGYTNLNGTAYESGAAIDSLGEYLAPGGTQYMLAVVNGEVKSIDPETGDEIENVKTGLTVGDKVDFLKAQGSCFFVSKSIVPQKWGGSGASSNSGGFPVSSGGLTYSKPSIIERHNNRTVFLNFEGNTAIQGSHLLISNDLDPETFDLGATPTTNAAIIEVSPGDGQKITGAKTIPVPNTDTNDTVLLIFKERSVYYMTGYFKNEFVIKRIDSDAGCLNNNCVIQVGSDVIFMGEKNIYSFTTALQSGTLQPRAVGSENVITSLRSMNLAYKHLAWGIHLPWRNEIWFGFPSNASTVVDKIIVYRYPTSDGETPAFSTKKDADHLCGVVFNSELYTGTNDGYIGQWFNSSKHGEAPIHWSFKYPFYDFGAFEVNKTLHDLKLYFLARAQETVTVTTEWRGGSGAQRQISPKVIQFTGDLGAMYGTALYGSAYYGAGVVLSMVSLKPRGVGQQLQIKVAGTSASSGLVFLGVSGEVEFLDQARGYAF